MLIPDQTVFPRSRSELPLHHGLMGQRRPADKLVGTVLLCIHRKYRLLSSVLHDMRARVGGTERKL